MKKFSKSLIAAAVLAASSTAAMAEISMNVGATSNYLWRGVSQTGDDAAVSGGVDYAHESGVYAGMWASNLGDVDFGWYGTEVDYYAGYAGEFSGVGYDIGYISYTYGEMEEDGIDANFAEVYVGVSYDMFSAKYSVDNDNDNSYIEVGADIALPQEFGLGLHYGSYSFDDAALEDYTDYSVSLSKGDVSLTYSNMSENEAWGQTDNARIAVSWGTSF